MRVLLTGATGFLGGHLARRLLAEGYRVRVLARCAARAKALMELGAEVVEGDVTEASTIDEALDDVEVVYHLAGKLYLPGIPAAEYYHTHVDGTRVLLDRARTCPRLERVVHCSTTGVLGSTGDYPADESAPYRPTNAYEETKLQSELLVREAQQDGLPAVIVRPGLVYGPGDLHLVGFFRAIENGWFRPIGRRPVWLHPIHIDDMIEAFLRCGRLPQAIGECFHIAAPEPVTLATLAASIADALRVPVKRGYLPLPAAHAVAAMGNLLPAGKRASAPLTPSRLDFLTHSRMYSVAKSERMLGAYATTSLTDGIAQTVAWYRCQGYLAPARQTA